MNQADPKKIRIKNTMAFTELASTNPDATRKFLEDAFDWRFDTVQMLNGQYLTYRNPQGNMVGIRPAQQAETPGSTNYVRVEDLNEAERKIRAMGAEIVLPRTDIPRMGSFFWFKIPAGPVMACWQDATKGSRQEE